MEPDIDPVFEVLLEDESVLIVSKSGNCPVHEGGLYKGNCMTAILQKAYLKRFYPVYRLDRETSGIVVFAKEGDYVKEARNNLSDKEYIAVVEGSIDSEIIVDEPIGECKGENIRWKKCVDPSGKTSRTKIIPIVQGEGFTAVKAILYTGRQHQIRVHLSYIGHPIIGDKVYKDDILFKEYLEGKCSGRQMLHLYQLRYKDKVLTSKIPKDMEHYISL